MKLDSGLKVACATFGRPSSGINMKSPNQDGFSSVRRTGTTRPTSSAEYWNKKILPFMLPWFWYAVTTQIPQRFKPLWAGWTSGPHKRNSTCRENETRERNSRHSILQMYTWRNESTRQMPSLESMTYSVFRLKYRKTSNQIFGCTQHSQGESRLPRK